MTVEWEETGYTVEQIGVGFDSGMASSIEDFSRKDPHHAQRFRSVTETARRFASLARHHHPSTLRIVRVTQFLESEAI